MDLLDRKRGRLRQPSRIQLMKNLLLALSAFLALSARAQFQPTNEINGTVDGSSYDIGATGFYGDYFSTFFYCMYPQWTNHIYSWSRSGSGWNGDYQSQEEKWCLPLWNSFAVPGYNWILANDNESLSSNGTYTAGQLILAGPPLFFNGTAQTNEGIATAGITHIPMGRIPHDSSDGDSGAIVGNDGSMQLAADNGIAIIDLWHRLWTNGWSADVMGNRVLGFSTGSHPFAPGGLAIAVQQLLGLNVETNVGSLTFNWFAATASTNHCTATGISVIGNKLTATVHFDRMPMAWDSPDGTITNSALPAFIAMPSIANAFNWIIQVTNLPPGNYEIDVDGHFADRCTSAELATGRNWATNCVSTNPLWLQRASVLARKREQKGADPVTLETHSAGVNGVITGVGDTVNYQSHAALFYDTDAHRGATFVSDMAPQVSDIRQYDVAIHNAAVQTNHTFTFTLAAPRLAPFHK
jgi:hypothetical protein